MVEEEAFAAGAAEASHAAVMAGAVTAAAAVAFPAVVTEEELTLAVG